MAQATMQNWERQVNSLPKETIQGERRSHRRYALNLGLSFRQVSGTKSIAEGTGKLGDISSGGVLFLTAAPPAMGATVELFVDWPYRGENGTPLHLLLFGRVVRRDGSSVAVQTIRHEFRPARSPGEVGVRQTRQSAAARRLEPVTVRP
jgi:hypothetical protein